MEGNENREALPPLPLAQRWIQSPVKETKEHPAQVITVLAKVSIAS